MAIHRLVALHVVDEAAYQAYRDAMTPMVEARGGFFAYDVRVSEVLRAQCQHPINRLFLLTFPDKATLDAFFSDPVYLAIRERYYPQAVAGATPIAVYESP